MRPSSRKKVAWIVTLSIVVASGVYWQCASINNNNLLGADVRLSLSTARNVKSDDASAADDGDEDIVPLVLATQTKTTTPTSRDNLKFCTFSSLGATGGGSRLRLRVEHPCAGPLYDAFAGRLHAFADNKTRFGRHWGRRVFAIPATKTVLFVGNPHTRLLAQVLACQHYHDDDDDASEEEDDVSTTTVTRNLIQQVTKLSQGAVRITFKNNATLLTVTNPSALFETNWSTKLAEQLNLTSLQHDVDALVLGLVDDRCTENILASNATTSATTTCTTAPTVSDWQAELRADTPLAFASSFTLNNQLTAQVALQDLRQQQGLKNQTALIFGRRYIGELQTECASGSKKNVGDCMDKTRGARCTGTAGGHVDLLAFDVAEFLHGTLGNGTDAFPAVPAPLELRSFQQEQVDQDYFFCRSPVIAAPHDIFSDTTNIDYQCQGPRYEAYGKALEHFVQTQRQPLPSRWAIPAHGRVLFFGNSHVKLVGKALACQQMEAGQLESINLLRTLGAAQMKFTNNATLVMLVNSFVPYSRDWLALLETELEMTLDSFDAVVYGYMNHCDGDNAFGRAMQEISNSRPDVDCLNIPAPNLIDLAAVYSKPIAFIQMLDGSRTSETQWLVNKLPSLHRDNISLLNGRQYRHKIGQECFSPIRLHVSDCAVDPVAVHASHTCSGPLGGTADLVAWDVVDFLHVHLGSDNT